MSGGSNFPLMNSERTALRYILQHGPAHGYQVYKKSDLKTDKTTYVALKNLTEKGLLERKSAKQKCRPGQPMQEYYLTLAGLTVGLTIFNDSWKKIDLITLKWEHLLPFVFKKWDLFKKHGLVEEVTKALKSSMEMYAMDWRYGHKWVDGGRAAIEDRFINAMVNRPYSIEVKMRWNKTLHSDKELRDTVEKHYKNHLIVSQAFVDVDKIKVEIITMLQQAEPNWEKIKKMELRTKPAVKISFT